MSLDRVLTAEGCCDGGKCHSAPEDNAAAWRRITQESAAKCAANRAEADAPARWTGDSLLASTGEDIRPGTTAKFGTGAVRSSDVEEFRYDLISPIGLREVARACAEGAEKYGDWNWERGMPVHDLLNHVLAHVYKFLAGDRSEPHLGHAAWGMLAAIHSHELWPELNEGNLREPGCRMPSEERTGSR
jgi:hypothetical protein